MIAAVPKDSLVAKWHGRQRPVEYSVKILLGASVAYLARNYVESDCTSTTMGALGRCSSNNNKMYRCMYCICTVPKLWAAMLLCDTGDLTAAY